jgi:lipid-binding SYLF domain-containing protein
MRFRIISSLISLVGLCCMFQLLGVAGLAKHRTNNSFRDAASQSTKAARVFKEIMAAPDKAIPEEVLEGAECVAVFPSVIKGGFVVGGQGGRGVASCRTPRGWSAPAFFDLKGGSFGLQIGGQSTDFILLFMNSRGLDRLIGDKFEIGGDASVAAGPVGRQTGASTNIRLDAEILSYSRSRGLFAGLELKGVVITQDKDDIEAVYGRGADARGVLKDSKFTASAEIRDFPTTLGRFSARKEKP